MRGLDGLISITLRYGELSTLFLNDIFECRDYFF